MEGTNVCLIALVMLTMFCTTGYASDFPFSYFTKLDHTGVDFDNKTAIRGYLNETECGRACLYAFDNDCVAFEYDFDQEECSLVTSDDVAQGINVTESKYSDYYERITGECPNPPVGLEDGTLPLSQISMSSHLGGDLDGPIDIAVDHVRLNRPGGWCAGESADVNNITEWIQIDFAEPKMIGAVATQGFNHPDLDDIYCSQYYLEYRFVDSNSDTSWVTYEESSATKYFDGNAGTNDTVTNTLATPVKATSMRLYPTVCQNHPCMRLEFYGCKVDCEPNPCIDATCSDDSSWMWNVTCDCSSSSGQTGPFCQLDKCATDPCNNGGTCVNGFDYYTCTCVPGYEGTDCDTNIDECASNPCQNGTCVDGINGYTCDCDSGFGGTNCDKYDVKCADGLYPGINSCYMVELSNDTDYYVARRTCIAIGGHLIFPNDATEHGIITSILSEIGVPTATQLRTGLAYGGSGRSLTFYDGSGQPTFDGWDSSYPSGSDGCVAMVNDGSAWGWGNVDCTSDMAYICEQEKAHGNFSEWGKWEPCSQTCGQGTQVRRRTCTDPAPFVGGRDCEGDNKETRDCGDICPIVECPEGFVTYYDRCYLLKVNESATYEEAKASCQNLTIYGGHLVLINSLEEETVLAGLLDQHYADTSLRYYTGSKYNATEQNYYFDWDFGYTQDWNETSWDAAGSSMWANGAASSNAGDECVLLEPSGTTWKAVNEPCSQSMGYVCEVNQGDGTWGPWHGWFECNATCVNGDDSGYKKKLRFCNNPAPSLGGAECVGDGKKLKSCSATCPIVTCPDGFDASYDSCYKIMDSSSDFTDQASAREACLLLTNDTGHLAFVQSQEELTFLGYRLDESLFSSRSHPVYVDLMQSGGTLYFNNGTELLNLTASVINSMWATGYPSSNNDECVAVIFEETPYQWLLRDVPCHRKLGYICEITQTEGNWGSWLGWSACNGTCGSGTQVRRRLCDNPPSILGGTTCSGAAKEERDCTSACDVVTCPDGFDVYSDSCYQFLVSTWDVQSLEDANVTCKMLTNDTGYVVQVDSYDEQFFLNWGLKDRGIAQDRRVFVGLTYDSSSSSMLYHGSANSGPSSGSWPNADWWAGGFPRNNPAKGCVAMVFDQASQEWLFGDVFCSDEYGFICEIPQTAGGEGEWGAWSACTDSCGSGTQLRTRECDDPAPVLGGQDCQLALNETRDCVDRCPIVDCPEGWIASYDNCYQLVDISRDYSSANLSCVTRSNNTGHLLYINNQTELDEISWILKKSSEPESHQFITGLLYESSALSFDDDSGTPDDSSWRSTEGAPWVNNYPAGAGTCVALAYNSRTWEWRLMNADCSDSDFYICEITQTAGQWGSWGSWSSCSQTCDESANMGTRHRNRTCSNPAPILEGPSCPGNATGYGPCGSQCPPVNGNYTDWVYGECSVSCYSWDDAGNRYGGVVNRTRNCTNPAPMYGGDDCSSLGEADETVSCGTEDGNACPAVDGNWGGWSNWSSCNVSCGSGFKIRTRSCDSPSTQHGGTECSGDDTDYLACDRLPCAVDGNWTEWSSWSTCSQTCIGGTQYRSRSCTNPTPAYNGTECTGDDSQYQNCSSETACPVDGQWTAWSEWSACSISCGGSGSRTRNRSCTDPAPANWGQNCPASDLSQESETCGTDGCPVDGNYGDWQSWSDCSINCGEGGVRYRHRPCDNPSPQYGGADCNLDDLYLREACNAADNCTTERENFYKQRSTSQSSTASGGGSGNAVDGVLSDSLSDGSCIETNVESAPYWQVDLGGVYTVRSVRIYVRTDDCYDCLWGLEPFVVRLGVSSTPRENVGCGDIVDWTVSSSYDIDCNLRAGRYLSIQYVGDVDIALSFCEVAVDIGSYAYFSDASFTLSEAAAQCEENGAELASPADLLDLYAKGDGHCTGGWLSDGTVRSVVPMAGCSGGSNTPGVQDHGAGATSQTNGAFCTERSEGSSLITSLNGSLELSASSSQSTLTSDLIWLYGSDDTQAWQPINSTDTEWIQIDFGEYVSVKGIATRGLPSGTDFVTGYFIFSSIDGENWDEYWAGTQLVNGNMDSSSVVRHSLSPLDTVRYLRLEPKTWNSSIAMRFDVYGTTQPVNGDFSEWNSWGSCSVECAGTGTRQRSRSCDLPPQQGGGLHCQGNRQRDLLAADPLQFSNNTGLGYLDAGDTATYSASSDSDCAVLCLREQQFVCASFAFSESNAACMLSSESVTFDGQTLTSHSSYSHYDLDYTSCNVHYIIAKARGQTPSDGVYMINMGGVARSVYCDMTRDGGGWTLVVTAATAQGWSASNVQERNVSNPSTSGDYSILSYADTIKDSGSGKTFKYRLESIARGRWGGIYEVPKNYTFTKTDSSQTSTLVAMFDTWQSSNTSLEHVMPWLTSDQNSLLRAHSGDTNSAWAGTVVCDCSDLTWSPYTSFYSSDGDAGATTAPPTTNPPSTAPPTTQPSTAASGSRRRRDVDPNLEGDEDFAGFKYMYKIEGREVKFLANEVLSRRKRSAGSGSGEETFGTVWYWLREDHNDFEPSLGFDLSGRCPYDTDIEDCSSPCSENSIPATHGSIEGQMGSIPTLVDAHSNAAHKCAISLSQNYVSLGDSRESCLYNPALCGQGLTIAFWVRLTAGGTVDETTEIISSAGVEVSVSNVASSGVNLEIKVAIADDYLYTVSNDSIPDSEWFHVIVSYKRGNGLALFLNGVPSGSEPSSSTSAAVSTTLTNVYFGGKFENVTESAYDVTVVMSDLQFYFRRFSALDNMLMYLGFDANTEGEVCGSDPCPVHGGWTSWDDVTSCTVHCGSDGVKEQQRNCTNPSPEYGGNNCTGRAYRYVSCSGTSSCTDNSDVGLGMEAGNITDTYLTESSCSSSNDSCATWARLNDADSTHCWSPSNSNSAWLQIQLENPVDLRGVATSGRTSGDSYVKTYMVEASSDGTNWLMEYDGMYQKIYIGNFDNSTVVRHTVNLTSVSYVRFFPLSWNEAICLRVEIYGEYLPVDGQYGSWGEWSECNVTCGGGIQTKNRTCDNPAPKYGGASCQEASTKSRECGTRNCPIDGGWTSWETTVDCSISCGQNGIKREDRNCTNPPKQYGGAPCTGDVYRWVSCDAASSCSGNEDTELGVVNGDLADSQFSESSCSSSSSCGETARLSSSTSSDCWIPVNSTTSEWLQVNLTTPVTLEGVAIQGRPDDDLFVTSYYLQTAQTEESAYKYYKEDGRRKLFQGNVDNTDIVRYDLTGLDEVTFIRFVPQSWNGSICMRVGLYGAYNPVDGGWGSWSSWGNCSTTCGGGVQYRNRTCTNPTPLYGGSDCSGESWQVTDCSNNNCPIDGGFSAWYDVSNCTISCGTKGTLRQERDCTNPKPRYGGDSCHGYTSRWVTCDATAACSAADDASLGVADSSNSDITLSASSNGLDATKARLDAVSTGDAWIPAATDERPYLQVELPDLVNVKRVATQGWLDDSGQKGWVETFRLSYSDDGSNWRQYKDASGAIKLFQGNFDETTAVYNELDPVLENVTHVRFYPKEYNGSIALRVDLFGVYNPRDGNWTEWSAWTSCAVSCGGSWETRNRTCTNPSALYGGNDCPSSEKANEQRQCNTQSCPTDGDWTLWASWATFDCSVSCGTDGVKHRTRSCTNPAPQHGGSGCTNPLYTEEFLACDAAGACGECYEPLGMHDGRIADWQLSVSNERYNDTNLAQHARLDVTATNALCWEGVTNATDASADYWLQIDFVTPIELSMLGTQGGGTIERWVTYYNVSLTTDGVNWYDYEEDGETKTFYGNIDKSTVVRTTLDSAQTNIKSLRIIPVAWEGVGPCLRTEVYGCYNHPTCSDSVTVDTASTVAAAGSVPQHVQLDLSSLQRVTQIRTKATSQTWYKSYYISFSHNEFDWVLYTEDGQQKVFQGNYDSVTEVTNAFLNPFHARYVKVIPVEVNTQVSDDIDIYTCGANVPQDTTPSSTICFTPFGFADHSFNLTHRLTASSIYPSANDTLYIPHYARLHNPSNPSSGYQGWVSANSDVDGSYASADQWYQVDFEERVTVTGLALQGVPLTGDLNATFDRFSLWYAEDGVDWKPMRKMGSKEVKVLDGPTNGHQVVLYELTDDLDSDMRPLDLRYLRIQAEFNTSESVGLRLEIYGCSASVDTECRDGWSEFQTSCYQVSTETKSRAAAKRACENEGAHLATITSLDEQRFLRKFVRAYDVSDFNIGFKRHGKNFKWIDDTFVVYTSWAESQPLYEQFKKCVALSKDADGKWVSIDCDNKIGFVCEYEREFTDVFACAENTISLHCPDNQKVNITGGDWGRTLPWEVCPQESTFTSSDTPCTSVGTATYANIDRFAEECANVSHCSLLADTSTLGYPCSTAGMKLHVNLTYTCVEYMKYARACEGDFLDISCPASGQVLHIQDAMYGRTLDNSVCPGGDPSAPTNCTLSSAVSEVRTYCEAQHSCKVAVEPEAFTSDPCVGVSKYLDVNYTCVSAAPVITDEYTYQGDCEEGWTKHDARCIKGFPQQSLTYRQAEDRCNSLHGHLAGVPGAHTQQFLAGLMTDYSSTDFWIGCVKTNNNTCRWKDGIGHVFTDFNSAYVSDGYQRCIHLSADHSFQWEDASCSDTNAFICQQDCVLTFGMADKTIRNDQLEASSTKLLSSLDSFKWNGRLNDPYGAWVASDQETQQWFQIDFERVMRVRKFATQGHPRNDFWVTNYALDYTVNDTLAENGDWNAYVEDGERRIFAGNNDSNTIVYAYLTHFMFARFIRVLPLNWTNEIALRLEVYGCFLEDEKPEVLEVTNTTVLHYGYNGTIQCLAFGMPLPNITWIRDGDHYTGGDNATIVNHVLDDHHMISEIRFHQMWDDRGYYTCVAKNRHGSDRSSFYNHKGTPVYEGGKIVCDDEDMKLECPMGEYIQITEAFYGRMHNEKCIIYDDYYPTDCEYDPDTVMHRLQRQCDKKEHCVVHTSEAMFGAMGDNYTRCDGFTKYINMTYECIGYEWTDWYNTDSPSDGVEDESHYSIYKTSSTLCADPQDVECRRASDQQSHYAVGQVLQRPCTVNSEGGLLCYDTDQSSGTCGDYEVRFLCPEEELGIWGHERAVECDDEELALACQADYSIKIHRAFYGRREEGLCTLGNNYTYSLDCGLDEETVLKMVRKNCDNKQSCRLNVEFATVLSDPCPEQPKYLDVRFSCERYRSDFARGKAANMSSLATTDDVANLTTDYFLEVDCSQGWCAQSAAEYEPWWIVDLQATYDINVVTVYTCDSSSDAAALDNFQVRIGNSSDLNFNEDCGEVVSSANPGANPVFCNHTMRGRYISIQLLGRTDAIQICEVTVQHLGPAAVKAMACDDQLLELSCAVNEIGYLQIESVFYGRREGGKHCPHRWSNHTYDTSCDTDPSVIMGLVEAQCKNERQCSIDVTTDILGSLNSDPCQGELKYLEVEYTCHKFRQGNSTESTTYTACKEENLQIACYGDNRFIEITSASYLPVTASSPSYCVETPSDNSASCSSQDVKSAVAAQCDNKVTCTVRADAYYLGATRCTTHRMQLELTFNCKDELPTGEITLFGCEGLDGELSLSCPDGTFININEAFYGRTQVGSTSHVCPALDGLDDTTTCQSDDTQGIVEEYCQDQRACSIPVDGSLLSSTDPCSSISSKYLQVAYQCDAGRPLNDINLYACEDHDDLSVECPADYPYVRILEADYGRTEGDAFRCAYRENLRSFTSYQECSTPGVLADARSRCTNQRNCTVLSHWKNYVNQEPCLGTYKYLRVKYRCLMGPIDYTRGDRWYFVNPHQTLKEHRLENHRIDNVRVRNFLECANHCLNTTDCVSFNYKDNWSSAGYLCQLNDMIVDEVPYDFTYSKGFQYYEKDSYRVR